MRCWYRYVILGTVPVRVCEKTTVPVQICGAIVVSVQTCKELAVPARICGEITVPVQICKEIAVPVQISHSYYDFYNQVFYRYFGESLCHYLDVLGCVFHREPGAHQFAWEPACRPIWYPGTVAARGGAG